MNRDESKWRVTCSIGGGELEEYEVEGGPKLDKDWALFFVRGMNGANLIAYAFPTSSVVSVELMSERG